MATSRRLNVTGAAQRAKANTPPTAAPVTRKPHDTVPAAPAPRRASSAPVRRSTTVSLRQAGQSDPTQEAMVSETLEHREIAPARLAHVRFGAGLTINLGNFESARLDVQVELPCDVEGLTEAMEEASEFVQARLAEEEARWAPK